MFDDKFMGQVYQFNSASAQPCVCCGARLRKSNSKFQMNRSNYINIKANKQENFISKDGKREIVCIETSNGPLTIGMRYEW